MADQKEKKESDVNKSADSLCTAISDKHDGGESQTVKADSNEIDEELNELLDSALKDFERQPVKDSEGEHCIGDVPHPSGADKGSSNKGASHAPNASDPMSDLFAEEFSEEMAKQLEEAMKSFMSEDPNMMQHIQKLAEAAGNTDDSPESQQEFTATLAQTLSSMAHNTEELQDGGMSEEELMKALSGMGLEDSGGQPQEESFMPMMQGMMKTLLSKDVLYPSLKEISEKYPQWLEENKEKTEAAQIEKYRKQYGLIKDICQEFESENSGDTDDVKKQRFERTLDLMQQMQELGQPPKDIVGEMAPGLEFDENGLPRVPSGMQGCVLM